MHLGFVQLGWWYLEIKISGLARGWSSCNITATISHDMKQR